MLTSRPSTDKDTQQAARSNRPVICRWLIQQGANTFVGTRNSSLEYRTTPWKEMGQTDWYVQSSVSWYLPLLYDEAPFLPFVSPRVTDFSCSCQESIALGGNERWRLLLFLLQDFRLQLSARPDFSKVEAGYYQSPG